MGDGRWPQPSSSELAILYGNPYYSPVRPGRRTLLFNEWGTTGFNKGYVSYPSFVDAKSGYIIVSERDNHRLQIFDNVGAPSRFDRRAPTRVFSARFSLRLSASFVGVDLLSQVS